jgi:hypothetical protein
MSLVGGGSVDFAIAASHANRDSMAVPAAVVLGSGRRYSTAAVVRSSDARRQRCPAVASSLPTASQFQQKRVADAGCRHPYSWR